MKLINKERKLNKEKKTPLHYAAENNSKEMTELFIQIYYYEI